MGFHVNSYVSSEEEAVHTHNIPSKYVSMTSSGDVTLTFEDYQAFKMPDMLPFYLAAGYNPGEAFIDAVTNSTLLSSSRLQTKALMMPEEIGYCKGPAEEPLPMEMCQAVIDAGGYEFIDKVMEMLQSST